MNDHPFNILKYIDNLALMLSIYFSIIFFLLSILHHKYKEQLSEKDIDGIIQIQMLCFFVLVM